jgi:hypothetical protein
LSSSVTYLAYRSVPTLRVYFLERRLGITTTSWSSTVSEISHTSIHSSAKDRRVAETMKQQTYLGVALNKVMYITMSTSIKLCIKKTCIVRH